MKPTVAPDNKGILLVNLGSPASPTLLAVKNYLSEFLMDPYVLQMPKFFRFLFVYGLIRPFRPKKTLKSYQTIWKKEGSPLILESLKLKEIFQEVVKTKFHVEIAMRYGEPSLIKALSSFKEKNIQNVIVIPLYPQYATSTTQTTLAWLQKLNQSLYEKFFQFQFIKSFYNHPSYIHALSEKTKISLAKVNYDHVLMSFHGLPKSHLGQKVQSSLCTFQNCCQNISQENQNCYRAQSFATAQAIAQNLSLKEDQWSIGFQSRLTHGWIEPFTDKKISELAKRGVKNLAVLCPSFVTDCLETLEEIDIRARKQFLSEGGKNFYYIPCLNHDELWIKALKDLTTSL